MWVARHALASVIVAVAGAIAAGVFVFARPQYRPEIVSRDYDMSGRTHFTVQQVRRAFAAHGLPLRNGELASSDAPGAWLRPLVGPTGVEADVFGPRSHVGWGAGKQDTLNVLVGNVGVSYYGDDGAVVERAKAAIRDLER